MSTKSKNNICIVLDSAIEVEPKQLPRNTLTIERTGSLDGDTITLGTGKSSVDLTRSNSTASKVKLDALASHDISETYHRAVQNGAYHILSFHLPQHVYQGLNDARFTRNLSFHNQVYLIELLTTSGNAMGRLTQIIGKCLEYDWPLPPLLTLISQVRIRLRSVYIVPSNHSLLKQKRLKLPTLRKKFTLFTFDEGGKIRIEEKGDAATLVLLARNYLLKLVNDESQTEGTLQIRMNGFDETILDKSYLSGEIMPSTMLTAGLGESYIELSWIPTDETMKQIVIDIGSRYRLSSMVHDRPLGDYRVQLN